MTDKMPKQSSKFNITRLPDELLILDLESKEVHCLNTDAGLVFDACDGESTVEETILKLKHERDLDDADSFVWGALAAMESKGLLDSEDSGYTRRDFLSRSGMAASATALLITSLVLPEPANAQSTRR